MSNKNCIGENIKTFSLYSSAISTKFELKGLFIHSKKSQFSYVDDQFQFWGLP